MSEKSPTAVSQPKGEHGTMRSYVIGFILSLLFTFIAYFYVVNETASGTALLATILGFALLQMFVQIFFFLHLGRGPKPLYNVVFFGGTVGIILVVVVGSIFIMDNLYGNMSPSDVTKKLAQDEGIAQLNGKKTGACQEVHENHKVTVRDGKASPMAIEAKQCDTLTFINEDDTVRDIAFGAHPKHESYSGEEEESVRKGYPKSITLNQTGTFIFHDHLDPDISGIFTVAP